MSFHVPDRGRITTGRYATTTLDGNNGIFVIPCAMKQNKSTFKYVLFCLASDGLGWQHVSVSVKDLKMNQLGRVPTWGEMCHVKSIFWDADDVVMQLHPAEKDYVNTHPYTLHLWRPTFQLIPTPPPEMVGFRSPSTATDKSQVL